MSSATHHAFVKDSWQTPRNRRKLAYMALEKQEIAERIRELRHNKGNPPQTRVAKALGVSERTYQTWEQAEAKPGYDNLEALARFFRVSEEYILTGNASARPEDPVVVSETVESVRDYFDGRVDEMLTAIQNNRLELEQQNEFRGKVDRIISEVRRNRLEINKQNELLAEQSELLAQQRGLLAEMRDESARMREALRLLPAVQRLLEAEVATTGRPPAELPAPAVEEAPDVEEDRPRRAN